MITESMLYWITRLDGINGLLIVLVIILFFAAFVLIGPLQDSIITRENELRKKFRKYAGLILFNVLILSIALVMTPSTKEMAMIYILPKVVNSEYIEKTGGRLDHLSDLAFDKLEAILDIKEVVELEE